MHTGRKKYTGLDFSATFNSTAIPCEQCVQGSLQIVFSGTLNGIMSLECSDADASDNAWDPISDSSKAVTGSGSHTFSLRDGALNTKWIRLVYTRSSGTGTGFMYFTPKESTG